MRFKLNYLFVASALFFIVFGSTASAQTTVYKCESGGRTVTYSEKNCRGRIINTDEAPVPARANAREVDARRMEENKAMARTMQARAGESAEQFATRRRRVTLMPIDRDECARLDKRIPVEEGMLANPDPEEAAKAQEALGLSRKRFSQLGC